MHHSEKSAATRTEQAGGNDRVVFFIDQEKFVSESSLLTPRTILTVYAMEDANVTTLVRKDGGGATKFMDLDTPFEVKNGTKFTVLHNGPTPVS